MLARHLLTEHELSLATIPRPFLHWNSHKMATKQTSQPRSQLWCPADSNPNQDQNCNC